MNDTSKDRLGIIAGGGKIPQLLVQACETQQRPYTVVGLEGHADSLTTPPAIWVRVGQAGKCFQKFREDKVSSVVMAGKVMRPGLFELRPDWRTIKFLVRAGAKAFVDKNSVGDDRLLRLVIAEIEREGFSVVGLESLLSNLVASPGKVGTVAPSQMDQQEIAAGMNAAREHGAADRGQAVIIRDGSVVATEGIEGTDHLIRDATNLSDSGSKPILVKASKPQQDRRADLPVIGPETVNACIASGFRGIAIEAGGTLIVDKRAVAELADRAGLFVYAVGDGPSGAAS